MAETESQVYALVFGRVIAYLREQRALSQAALAERCGFTQPTLSRIEHGQALPDAFGMRALAGALGLTTAELSEHVERAFGQTEHVARSSIAGMPSLAQPQAQPARNSAKQLQWWQVALGAAGVAGLAGLAAFAVASALDKSTKKTPPATAPRVPAPPARRRR